MPEVTGISGEPLGITFRETMSGAFALGATDPEDGRILGERARTDLSLSASITIRDVKRFMSEDDESGAIVGHVDFTPFGKAIPGRGGTFKLFSQEGAPDLRVMSYELGFEHAGKPYYLAGRKLVREDAGLELWKDTTTLLTQLHHGEDARGPVVGAGVLRLSMADLIRMVSTMRMLGGGSSADQAAGLAEFGRFFMRSLWSMYGRPSWE
jgi:cholesterol oxidase